jgi:hypothetical protein
VPFLIASVACLIAGVHGLLAPGGDISVPLAGTGVLFGALAMFLLANGALAELVFKTGDIDVNALAQLTMDAAHE